MYDADDDGRAGAWERHTMDYIWTGAPYSLYIYRRVRVIIGLVDDVDIFLYGAHTKKRSKLYRHHADCCTTAIRAISIRREGALARALLWWRWHSVYIIIITRPLYIHCSRGKANYGQHVPSSPFLFVTKLKTAGHQMMERQHSSGTTFKYYSSTV